MATIEAPTPPAAPAPSPVRIASRVPYLLAALLAVVALGACGLWAFAGMTAVGASVDNLTRAGTPGVISLDAHPGAWYVYAESGAVFTAGDVQVTDPNGQAVAVSPFSGSSGNAEFGRMVQGVATFTVPVGGMGTYRVAVTRTTGSSMGTGEFSVGTFNVRSFTLPQQVGVLALLVVNLGAAVTIVVVTLRARRRVAM